MNAFSHPIRAGILLAASSLTLSGCLLSPGQFTSELHLLKDGSFTYTYDGEIQMLALSKLAAMDGDAEEEFFAYCTDEETYEERECTAEEVTAQKAEWDAAAASREEDRQQEIEEMKALFGGIDPTDPEAAQELASKLERQRGWEKVEYRGDGLFDVDFRVSGALSHDFAFPMIEKVPMTNVFVAVYLRDQGQIRVDAPGFATSSGGMPMLGMVGGFSGLARMEEVKKSGESSQLVSPNGTFTIVTDGRILANNTDEGPTTNGGKQALTWAVTPRTQEAPSALIAFD